MIVKTENEIENLVFAGRYLGEILRELVAMVKPGVTTAQLDMAAEKGIKERGGIPAFLGYKPSGMKYPYPAVLCASINEEVVHGIPRETRVLKEGDTISLDLGLSYNGFFADCAVTIPVGKVDKDSTKLMDATREALAEAIKAAKIGNHIGDIGEAVERVAKKYNLAIVEDLGGHAIGKKLHEAPFIPNEGKTGEGEKIVEGLALAIEPMLSLGSPKIVLDEEDQWTYRMEDGARAAHFEHTVLVTKQGPQILTQ